MSMEADASPIPLEPLLFEPKADCRSRLLRWGTLTLIRLATNTLCRLDISELKQVPVRGPLIIYTNHTGSLEVPLLLAHLQPRPITGFAKAETWDNPFLGEVFTLWGAIPLRRGEADTQAMRLALEALNKGWIVAVAPEGTRNRTGRLLRGQPGIVMLALRSGAPLLPIAHWGGEKFRSNLKRLKRTDFHVRVGEVFRLEPLSRRPTREERQALTDEMMRRLARLLPEEYRGAYSDV
jgi:1-acyl-sn-glycerol-3-phosphate acyltransferase